MRSATLGLFVLLLTVASPAAAYEDQWSLGVSAGYANAVSDRAPAHGVLGELNLAVGLDDVWSTRGRLSFAHHPGDDSMQVIIAGAELLYMIDVLEVVPYFGAGVDGLGVVFDGGIGSDLALHTVFGLDWLASRDITLGLDLRSLFLVTALDSDPVYLVGGLTCSLMFDL